jgi:cytochrome c oxidase subunit II
MGLVGLGSFGRVRPSPNPWRLVAITAVLLAVATGVVVLALVAWDLPSFGMPEPASEEGDAVAGLWRGFFLAAMAVGALVWGLLIYCVVRFRRRSGDDSIPRQTRYNIPFEILYTATPVVVVAVLFGFSMVAEDKVTDVDERADVTVDVVGFQWSWQFDYPDEGVTVTGEPEAPPPELVLPVDQVVHLRLVASDVNHSFWVPDFLSKRDLIPGVDNEIQITPTRTGTYVGRCAEFCGLDHWRMQYTVRVVTADEYEDWVASQRDAR